MDFLSRAELQKATKQIPHPVKFTNIDFDLEDIRLAIKNGIEFIWIPGDSIEPFDMEELEK